MYIETQRKVKIKENLTINELDSGEYRKLISKLQNEGAYEENEEYEEVTRLYTTREREDVDRGFGLL